MMTEKLASKSRCLFFAETKARFGTSNDKLYYFGEFRHQVILKRPQVTETRAFPRIGYELITAKTRVKIHFVHYLNFY